MTKKSTNIKLFLPVLIIIQVRLEVENRINTAIFISISHIILFEGLGDVFKHVSKVVVVGDGAVRHVEGLLGRGAQLAGAEGYEEGD